MPITLDVTEPLKRLIERGDLKNEMTVTLVPMGVSKSPERFSFDAKANPRIDAILLKIERMSERPMMGKMLTCSCGSPL